MVIGKKIWKTMSLFLVAAMIVSAVPALTVSAQNEAVVAAQVRGELNEQFAKHYLELQVTDPTQSVRIVMDYNPKDRQELDQGAGFYVFDEAGFRSLVNGANPATANLAVGALETATGVKQKVAIIADPVGSFTVVPYNDSTVPMDYTLTVENAVLRDASGDQVTNPLAPAVDSADDAATTDETTTDETTTEEATVVATVEATATVTTTTATTDTATTGTTTVVTATATPEAVTAVSATPPIIRVSQLEGELNERFAMHYYELQTQDIGREVTIEMTYNPQDQQALDNGLNFYVFTADQFRSLTRAPSSADNTAAGELLANSSPKTKRAVINEPFSTYTVIVENNSDIPADYQLTVDNAILIDESGQSITAQELGAGTVTATGEITGTATTTTTTTAAGTTTTTTATTGAAAITPPTTYTVVAGDTLGTIANRAYGSVQLYSRLCAYNNIANCNLIEVGDEIEIPAQADLPSAATTTQTTATPAAAATPTAVATPAVGASTTVTETTPAETDTEAGTETDTETDTEADTETPATTVNTTATGDLVATASSFSVLDTLGLLLDLLELEQDPSNNIKAVLQGGNYTFFAPTDTAFTSLDEATLETLIANPSQLATVLRGHIVPGQVVAADLSDGMMIETLAGTMLPVTVNGSTVTVGGATVAQSDVLATNGVIHVIDTVLTGAE